MTIEIQWFGPLSTVLIVLLVGLGYWIGKKRGGVIGAFIGVAVFGVLYVISSTYSPKLAIDSAPIQDVYREESEIVTPEKDDFEPRFEDRVKKTRDGVLENQ